MLKISNVTLSKLEASEYVVPLKMSYTQADVPKTWDLIQSHHSVVIIIYNTTRKALICVKQFRPAVYFNSVPIGDRVTSICTEKYPTKLGVTLEFCAGIVDKNKSLPEIAVEEVLEECGYRITTNDLTLVKSYRNAVGVAGDVSTLFYAEVTDDMKVSEGGGIDNELIEVVHIPLDEAKLILTDEKKSSEYNVAGEFLFGLSWFLNKISEKL